MPNPRAVPLSPEQEARLTQLVALGGRPRLTKAQRRVVFTDLAARCGLIILRDNPDRPDYISLATWNGAPIHYKAARWLLDMLKKGHVWYDLDHGAWGTYGEFERTLMRGDTLWDALERARASLMADAAFEDTACNHR